VQWIGSPVVATLMILLVVATFHHVQLGLQVVIEDYVHNEPVKITMIVGVKGTAVVLGLTAVVAVLRIAVGAWG